VWIANLVSYYLVEHVLLDFEVLFRSLVHVHQLLFVFTVTRQVGVVNNAFSIAEGIDRLDLHSL
jgi:hypothetical protein